MNQADSPEVRKNSPIYVLYLFYNAVHKRRKEFLFLAGPAFSRVWLQVSGSEVKFI